MPVEDVARRWRASPPADVPAALAGVYQAYGDREQKLAVGDKTPSFVASIPLLAAAFPQARFVHLVRDGRAVALSLIERQQPPHRLPEAALYWARQVTAARSSAATLPDRYLEVRYEDLLEDPEQELRRVCRFLGLTYTQEMLDYQSRAAAVAATFPDPEVQANLARPLTKGLRDWQRLPERHIALLNRIAGPALRAHGYPVEGARPGIIAWRATTLAGWETARWRVTRSYRMARRVLTRRVERRVTLLEVSPDPDPAR